jgi:hypothetical protein
MNCKDAFFLTPGTKSVHRRFVHSTAQIRRYYTLAWVTQCTNVMWLDLAGRSGGTISYIEGCIVTPHGSGKSRPINALITHAMLIGYARVATLDEPLPV